MAKSQNTLAAKGNNIKEQNKQNNKNQKNYVRIYLSGAAPNRA